MKKLLFLCLFIPWMFPVAGQTIVDSTKLWSVAYFHYSNFSHTSEFIKFSNDTVIGEFNYKKVEKSTDENHTVWEFHGYARETSDKKVYYRLDALHSEKLLYDLNVNPGDSLLVYTLYNYPLAIFDSMMYHVTGKDSVLIGETYRTQYHLSLNWPGYIQEVDQWVDSVGSLKSGMLHNTTGKVGGDGFDLLCFYENSVLTYDNPSLESCYVVTGMENHAEPRCIVSLQPNPLVDISSIRIDGNGVSSSFIIKFYNTTGRLISTYGFTEELQLRRQNYDPGLYFYIITSNGRKIGNGKMMVE